MSLLGVLFAGGGSRRFGAPKALARLHGRPLWAFGVDALRPCGRGVVALANDPAVARALPVETRSDVRQGQGPMGGLETALLWAQETSSAGALILGCDMPWVGQGPVTAILEEWDAEGVVSVEADGRWGFEPLCSAVPTSALEEVSRRLDEGALELGGALSAMGPRILPSRADWSDAFRSVNRPSDLPPPTVAVVGNKKSGKTTVAVALIAELERRGRRVMSAKHGHHFRLDAEGTDSWRHRHEGRAERVLLAGPEGFALQGSWGDAGEPDLEVLGCSHLAGAELIIAEGFRTSRVPKVEVWRRRAQPEPAIDPDRTVEAGVFVRVTDEPDAMSPVPTLDADAQDLAAQLADLVEARLFGS